MSGSNLSDNSMATLHVADLDRRVAAAKARRQSRNLVRNLRAPSPASSTGTFFDDDDDDDINIETTSTNTSWSTDSRADSAMSARSEDRRKMAHSPLRSTVTDGGPAPLPQQQYVQPNSAKQPMWPPALRIVKSPTWEQPRAARTPVSATPSHNSSQDSLHLSPQTSRSTDSIMGRPRPKTQRRLGSIANLKDSSSSSSGYDSSSSIYSRDPHSCLTTPDSAIGFGNPWDKKDLSPSISPVILDPPAVMGSAPREVRLHDRRSRMQAPGPSPYQPSSKPAWSSAPVVSRQIPPAEMPDRMPTPPQTPGPLLSEAVYDPADSLEFADIVIGRKLTVKTKHERSTSVPEKALSPKSPHFAGMAFPRPPSRSSNCSRATRIHVGHPSMPGSPSLASPDKQLPPHPYTKRRSLSADETNKRASRNTTTSNGTAIHRTLHSSTTAPILSPTCYSPIQTSRTEAPPPVQQVDISRTASLADTIRDLNAKSATHFARYTRLRHARQLLHSAILTALQQNPPPTKPAKTALQMQLEIATLDAGIDECVSKLAALERKRTAATEELLRSLPGAGNGVAHSRKGSLGTVEVCATPTSPMAARTGGGWVMKRLPSVPKGDKGKTGVKVDLSLASVMDFLDTSEEDAY